jgi:predicted Zn-dependent protease
MKTALFAALAISLLAAPSYAKTYELPTANPAVSVDLPDGWKPDETENGAQASSPDNETYVSVETATAKGFEQLIQDDIEYLAKAGVVVDDKTQESKDTKVNGMDASMLHWKAKDKEGPTAVTLWIIGVSEKLLVLTTVTSTAAGDKANGDILSKIMNSIKKQ